MPFDVAGVVEVEAPNKKELRILDEMVETSSEAVNLPLFNDSIAKSFDDVLKVYARARKLFE